jgi:predicted phage terminase large subunit-like protein
MTEKPRGPDPEAPVRARRRAEKEAARAAAAAAKAAQPKKKRGPKPKPKKKPAPETKTCAQCAKVYTKKDARYSTKAEWDLRKFCSAECALEHSRANPEKHISKRLIEYQEQRLSTDSKAMQEIARRALARKSLLYFTKKTHPKYESGWVHADICDRLERFAQQVAEKKSPRLMLLMPPRHGKSELASIRFPAWYLGQHPDHEIINVGYNLDLPMRWSRKVRELARDPVFTGIFPECVLDPENSAAEAWLTTAAGGFTAAGVGGGITGKGAHVLIVDDPIKNMEEADSPTTREALWDWFWSTAYTRLAPGGGVLLIQTWWNDDDLAGRLQQMSKQSPEADQYEVIKYPALAEQYEYRHAETLEITRTSQALHTKEEDDLVTIQRNMGVDLPRLVDNPEPLEILRRPGDALHPARYDEVALGKMKASMMSRVWSALFQQNPVPDEGMLFRKEYFKYAAATPAISGLNVYTAWDFAIGQKQQNDWTVGATVIQDPADSLYVAEIVRFKGDALQIIDAMIAAAQRWRPPTGGYLVGAEDGQIWRSIEPILRHKLNAKRIYMPIQVMKPLTDKLARARPLQGRMQSGTMIFPKDALWRNDMEIELLRFPAGAHDDIVDALAWVVHLATGRPPPNLWRAPVRTSWKDKLEHLDAEQFNHMRA